MVTEAQAREWLAAKEVAAELRVHVSAVYRAVERGQLPAVRLSATGAIRIPRSALDPARRDES
jgi:excisionase family DNA binding protein